MRRSLMGSAAGLGLRGDFRIGDPWRMGSLGEMTVRI